MVRDGVLDQHLVGKQQEPGRRPGRQVRHHRKPVYRRTHLTPPAAQGWRAGGAVIVDPRTALIRRISRRRGSGSGSGGKASTPVQPRPSPPGRRCRRGNNLTNASSRTRARADSVRRTSARSGCRIVKTSRSSGRSPGRVLGHHRRPGRLLRHPRRNCSRRDHVAQVGRAAPSDSCRWHVTTRKVAAVSHRLHVADACGRIRERSQCCRFADQRSPWRDSQIRNSSDATCAVFGTPPVDSKPCQPADLGARCRSACMASASSPSATRPGSWLPATTLTSGPTAFTPRPVHRRPGSRAASQAHRHNRAWPGVRRCGDRRVGIEGETRNSLRSHPTPEPTRPERADLTACAPMS